MESGQRLLVTTRAPDGAIGQFSVLVHIDTANELDHFRHDGILPFVVRQALK